ncbi:hypothetical protein PHLGIDRAFT_464673 [Phlebiopsis gigantea 11061_1 CR5-6]|uniref:Uncharacterized protein n=1 Tax=Phlebiopsis gigantea (strain 11061_1 CR5-6) TaxID=745531 RepID=A0A0C3S6N3_PHLG1|nr:hypothetical protein PHLGIDRAFT_464673 [Phlebiopsis gigantea 11061_1 CR5-6]
MAVLDNIKDCCPAQLDSRQHLLPRRLATLYSTAGSVEARLPARLRSRGGLIGTSTNTSIRLGGRRVDDEPHVWSEATDAVLTDKTLSLRSEERVRAEVTMDISDDVLACVRIDTSDDADAMLSIDTSIVSLSHTRTRDCHERRGGTLLAVGSVTRSMWSSRLPRTVASSTDMALPRTVASSTDMALPRTVASSTDMVLPRSVDMSTSTALPRSVIASMSAHWLCSI